MAEKMKVIWLVNVLFPEASKELGVEAPVIGGWLYSYKNIVDRYCSNISLFIVSPYEGNEFRYMEINGTSYFVFPKNAGKKDISKYFVHIYKEVNPDIVHIHGSEYIHSKIFSEVCDSRKVVLSIQGMTSVYSNYIYCGLDRSKLFASFSLRDFLKREQISDLYRSFVYSGEKEMDLIRSIGNVIGRTSWDRANTLAINENIDYHICQEPLRDSFYCNKWSVDKCERHSIFLSQVHYSIKGLHMFLRALPIIKREYPDVKVYVTGENLTLKPWYKITTYWKYIKKEIYRLGVAENLCFLGRLDEKSMVEAYLKAHIFVCPSSIENSSNSVCEAQLLGTPVIATYVGGMMDLIDDWRTGCLYRFEEYTMLAEKVCRLFAEDSLTVRMSEEERKVAKVRHNMESIALSLESIYNSIVEKCMF